MGEWRGEVTPAGPLNHQALALLSPGSCPKLRSSERDLVPLRRDSLRLSGLARRAEPVAIWDGLAGQQLKLRLAAVAHDRRDDLFLCAPPVAGLAGPDSWYF